MIQYIVGEKARHSTILLDTRDAQRLALEHHDELQVHKHNRPDKESCAEQYTARREHADDTDGE